MELGFFTGNYQRYGLARCFSDAKALGYDYIELWGGRPHGFAPDLASGQLTQVLRLMEQYELPVPVYTPELNGYPYNFMSGTTAQWEDTMTYLELCVSMGAALGAEYTVIAAGHGGYESTQTQLHQRLTNTLHRLTHHAEGLKHTVVLETLTPFESNLCHRSDELAQILKEIDSPYLMGMCDTVVPHTVGEPCLSYCDHLGDRLVHLHLVDGDGISDTHMVPGEGNLDIENLLWGLTHRGYTGRMTIELVAAYLADPMLAAKRGIDYVRALQEKITSKGI